MIFLVGRDRRNIAIQLLDTGKNFVEEQERSLVRIRLQFIAEGVINKGAAIFQLLLGSLGHFADNRFGHPFAPLVNRKG